MPESFNPIIAGFLAAFVVITWLSSRYLGVIGMIIGHVFVLMGYLWIVALAMDAGRYEYHGLLSMIGLFVQAFVLNCLLLPIACIALWRRRSAST